MRIKVDKLPETCYECIFLLSNKKCDSWKDDDYCVAQQEYINWSRTHRTRDEKCPLEVCDMKCQPIGHIDTSAFYNTNRMPFIGKMWKIVKEIK